MNPQATPSEERRRDWDWFIIIGAALIALCSALPWAGSWNDGSRLATAEALVDYHTWSIDSSIFVRPDTRRRGAPYPFWINDYGLNQYGTRDKLLINGLYYSDKSPLPSVWLAAVYAGFQFCTGFTARANADVFCYVLTLATSGLAYVVAVWSIYRLGRPLRLPHPWPLLLAASFALATIALPYVRHVNNHILLLGIVAPLIVEMAWVARGAATLSRLVRLGVLAGLSYTIDIGTGPVLLGGAAVWLAYRCRRPTMLAAFALAAAPWVLLHHVLNYAIGGTLGPANGVLAYLEWPGSPFNAHTMTGVWSHPSAASFVLYALDLLAGKQGFLTHNLALWLAIPACCWLLCRRPSADRPELLLSAGWCVGVWLLYSVSSTNHSGVCCSIRWFVPLLAPGYYVLAVWLRDCRPTYRRDFLVLSAWGAVLGASMWWVGPWVPHLIPGFWAVMTAGLASWLVSIYLRWRDQGIAAAEAAGRLTEHRAA